MTPDLRTPRPVLTGLAGLSLLATAVAAGAGTVTLEWDPSLSEGVVLYRVFVGRTPGNYTERYDVPADQLRFAYTTASDALVYYFAVAAGDGTVIGPKSVEVSGSSGLSRGLVVGRERIVDSTTGTGAAARAAVATGVRRGVRLMAALPDGRFLLVQDDRVVTIADAAGRGVGLPVDEVDPGTRVSAVAVDPRFPSTRVVLIGETTVGPGGQATFAIRRYRELGGVLGEGATIVTGLPVVRQGNPAIGLDAAGFVYVALPASSPDAEGSILRFSIDGSVPPSNPLGRPEMAAGPSRPVALITPAAGELWALDESDGWWHVSVEGEVGDGAAAARIRTARTPRPEGTTTVSAALTSDRTTGESRVFRVDEAGALWSGPLGSGGADSGVDLPSGAAAAAVTVAPSGAVYVALHVGDDTVGTAAVRIVRLPDR